MSNGNIDWRQILAQLVAQAIPIIIKMILDWLRGATDEEAVAMGARAKKAYKAFQDA